KWIKPGPPQGSMHMPILAGSWTTLFILGIGSLAMTLATANAVDQVEEDITIARSLAIMLQAGRSVISRNQELINNANIGDKGLTAEAVLSESHRIYQKNAGVDPRSLGTTSRHARLLRLMTESIAEVMNNNQKTINAPGIAFKGLIPATFA